MTVPPGKSHPPSNPQKPSTPKSNWLREPSITASKVDVPQSPVPGFRKRKYLRQRLLSINEYDGAYSTLQKLNLRQVEKLRAEVDSDEVVMKWLKTYENDKQEFASFTLFTEHKLNEIQTSYSTLAGRPNAVEAAALCATLNKMPGLLGAYASLLSKLYDGIQSCIYLPHDHTAPDPNSSMSSLVQNFYSRKTYFGRAQELERMMGAKGGLTSAEQVKLLSYDEVKHVVCNIPFVSLRKALQELFNREDSTTLRKSLLECLGASLEDNKKTDASLKPVTEEEAKEVAVKEICRNLVHYASAFTTVESEEIWHHVMAFLELDAMSRVLLQSRYYTKAWFLHELTNTDQVSTVELGNALSKLEAPDQCAYNMVMALYHTSNPIEAVDAFITKILDTDIVDTLVDSLISNLGEEKVKRIFFSNGKSDNRELSAASKAGMRGAQGRFKSKRNLGAKQSAASMFAALSSENLKLLLSDYIQENKSPSALAYDLISFILCPQLDSGDMQRLLEELVGCGDQNQQWDTISSLIERLLQDTSTGTLGSNMKNLLNLLWNATPLLDRDEWVENTVGPSNDAESRSRSSGVANVDVMPATIQTEPLDFSDPDPYIAQMSIETKIKWIKSLLGTLTCDNTDNAATMVLLKDALTPFVPNGMETSVTETVLEEELLEESKSKLLAESIVIESTDAASNEWKSKLHTNMLEEGMIEDTTIETSLVLSALRQSKDLLGDLEALLEKEGEDELLNRIRELVSAIKSGKELKENGDESTFVDEKDDVLSPLSKSDFKNKVNAVVAISDSMEWQEFVKPGHFNVGSQTNGEDIETVEREMYMHPDESSATGDHRKDTRTSISGRKKNQPLTMDALLASRTSIVGTTSTAAAGISALKKEAKVHKISSSNVPRPIAALITSWRMNAEQLLQFSKKSLATILKSIADAYADMLTANRRRALNAETTTSTSNSHSRKRELTIAQIVYQSNLHSYGLPSIADMHLLAFSCAVEHYRSEHIRVEYFARFCFEEVNKSDLVHYLEFLECLVSNEAASGPGVTTQQISNGSSGSAPDTTASTFHPPVQRRGKRMHVPKVSVPDKETWLVPLEKAHDAAQQCFRSMRKQSIATFCDHLVEIAQNAQSSVPIENGNAGLLVNVDHLLRLVVEEWHNEKKRREIHLLEAFQAGDVNGDGQLTSAEFAQIVLSIDQTRDPDDILLMYTETLRRTGCSSIDTGTFYQIALENDLDSACWNDEGELRHIVNDLSSLDNTWKSHMRSFFLGTLQALARDLPETHFLRFCEGAGCGCLHCILEGYVGFQRMRRERYCKIDSSTDEANSSKAYPASESLVWARYWHLMRQLYEAAAAGDGILSAWEGYGNLQTDAVPPFQPRLLYQRRNALPTLLFPDVNRVSAMVLTDTREDETFDSSKIRDQFSNLIKHMMFKDNEIGIH